MLAEKVSEGDARYAYIGMCNLPTSCEKFMPWSARYPERVVSIRELEGAQSTEHRVNADGVTLVNFPQSGTNVLWPPGVVDHVGCAYRLVNCCQLVIHL